MREYFTRQPFQMSVGNLTDQFSIGVATAVGALGLRGSAERRRIHTVFLGCGQGRNRMRAPASCGWFGRLTLPWGSDTIWAAEKSRWSGFFSKRLCDKIHKVGDFTAAAGDRCNWP